jgi:hypothetical protein
LQKLPTTQREEKITTANICSKHIISPFRRRRKNPEKHMKDEIERRIWEPGNLIIGQK